MREPVLVLLAIAAVGGCSEDEPVCSADVLAARLEDAAPGDVVEVGACRIEGRFRVPAGVTLRGAGRATVISSAESAIDLAGEGATVESLRVEHRSGHGVFGLGAGTRTVRNVEVASTLGRAAIAFDAAPRVSLIDVSVYGPVTRETATMIPELPTSADTALAGIVLRGVGDADLERVSVTGFGKAGLVASGTTLTWLGGSVAETLGVGVWIDGGGAVLDGVTIEGTLRGFRGAPTYGLVGARGAAVETTGTTVRATEDGFGVFQDGGTARHVALVTERHEYGAVFAQGTTSFVLAGGSEIRDNDFAGIVAVQAGGLNIEDATVTVTRSVPMMDGPWGSLSVGDGIQLVRPSPGTTLRRVVATDNERAGLLIDLGGGDTSTVSLEDVRAASGGTAVGCVVQNGSAVPGWDAGVTREGSALSNDPAFAGGLRVVDLVGAGDLPVSADVAGLIGPCE